MRGRDRILLILGAPLVLIGSVWFTAVLPGVRLCPSISCGDRFDPGGVNVFGHQNLTLLQTLVLATGIVAAASMLLVATLPRRSRWTALGGGLLVLAVVVTLALPLPATGPAPSRPCSTPGQDGPIHGRCTTGAAPVDGRARDRALIVAGGLVALAIGIALDRGRSTRGTRNSPVLA